MPTFGRPGLHLSLRERSDAQRPGEGSLYRDVSRDVLVSMSPRSGMGSPRAARIGCDSPS